MKIYLVVEYGFYGDGFNIHNSFFNINKAKKYIDDLRVNYGNRDWELLIEEDDDLYLWQSEEQRKNIGIFQVNLLE